MLYRYHGLLPPVAETGKHSPLRPRYLVGRTSVASVGAQTGTLTVSLRNGNCWNDSGCGVRGRFSDPHVADVGSGNDAIGGHRAVAQG